MKTKIFYIAIVSIAIGGLMWQMAGFGALFAGQSPGGQLGSTDKINESAEDSAIEGNFTGDANPDNGNLVGLILSGGQRMIELLGLVVFLPFELMTLGLPEWAARPIGQMAIIFLSIGAIQFIVGRYLQ